MKTYKRIVALCVGLCSVLATGAINALFMTPRSIWFESLIMPDISPNVHSLIWLVVYFMTSIVFAEFLIEKPLRRRIFCIFITLLGNALWCAVFFRVHSSIAAFAILCVILANLIYTLIITVKHTKSTCFIVALITGWYIFLTGLNLMIIILN